MKNIILLILLMLSQIGFSQFKPKQTFNNKATEFNNKKLNLTTTKSLIKSINKDIKLAKNIVFPSSLLSKSSKTIRENTEGVYAINSKLSTNALSTISTHRAMVAFVD